MKTNWKSELPFGAMIAVMFGLAALCWNRVGDKLPVHWNASGQVDRYGGKFEGLLLMPLVALGIYALFLVLPRLDPRRANYEQFGRAFRVTRLATLALLLAVYAAMLWNMQGHALDMARVTLPLSGLLFIVVGNAMGKFRPNWFVGIRTPWTLSSKTAWVKTHRVGGWTFIALGIAIIVEAALLPPATALNLMLTLLLCASLGLSAYSYLVWREADDKTPPTHLPAEDFAV